ncbi:MAG: tetratricopeptide repeat protein [Phaeodactylibacter sp.]|nr:tetratricopeptide repeat protein [Phaeodactylibacter sp.]
MRSLLGILLFSLFFVACSNENQQAEMSAIQEMEAALETNQDQDNVNKLIAEYEAYVENHPEDTEQNAEYMYRAGLLQYRSNRFNASLEYAKDVLKKYYDTDAAPKAALLMATIYKDKLQNEVGANAVMQAFVHAFPDNEQTPILRDSFLTNALELEKQIDTLKYEIFNEKTGKIEYRQAQDYIGVCEVYGLILPDAPLAPEYLHEAGKIAGYIQSHKKAMELYEWVYTKYPKSEKAPLALFMMGFTLQNELNDPDAAKPLYEEFLKKYPDHDFADDTQFLLSNMGKSDEEIIQNFEQQ